MNNNEKEFEFLNDIQEETTETNKNKFLDFIVLIISIFCDIIILIAESFYKLLHCILWTDTSISLYKTIKGKRKKTKRWF